MNDLILCIETSTDACSVAVARGPDLLVLETAEEAFQHASLITILIDRCMKRLSPSLGLANLNAIAISEGPGSFTGLRVGLSAAKGFSFALDIPMIAISTLKSLAAGAGMRLNATENQMYCSMIDARRMEVYCSIFDSELKEVAPPKAEILTETSFYQWLENGSEMIFVGNGAPKLNHLNAFKGHKILDLACSAEYLIQLAHEKNTRREYIDATNFSPKYLKPPNITKPRKVI